MPAQMKATTATHRGHPKLIESRTNIPPTRLNPEDAVVSLRCSSLMFIKATRRTYPRRPRASRIYPPVFRPDHSRTVPQLLTGQVSVTTRVIATSAGLGHHPLVPLPLNLPLPLLHL